MNTMTFNYSEISKIIKKSAKDAAKEGRIWKWFLTSGIGALLGTLSLGERIFQLEAERSIIFGIFFIVGLYVLRFFLIFFKETWKYFHEAYKNSIYGDAIILLKDGFSLTHSYRKASTHDDKNFMRIMMTFCNYLKEIYDKTTDSKCSVSIKVPKYDPSVNENTVLMNLTRDTSRDTSQQRRDTQQYVETKHTLMGNTAFTYCFNKVMANSNERHYINNRINKTDNYQTTSRECYDNGILPYNSELVIPITSIVRDDNKNADCHGFLCVDSNKENAFNSKYEIALLEGVADGVYDLISGRNSFNSNINNQTNGE